MNYIIEITCIYSKNDMFVYAAKILSNSRNFSFSFWFFSATKLEVT